MKLRGNRGSGEPGKDLPSGSGKPGKDLPSAKRLRKDSDEEEVPDKDAHKDAEKDAGVPSEKDGHDDGVQPKAVPRGVLDASSSETGGSDDDTSR